MKHKSILKALVVILAVFIFETYFYKIVALMFGILFLRKDISQWIAWKHTKLAVIVVCLLGLWFTSPRLRWDNNDRVRLIYQTEEYEPTNMPLLHYVANTLIPEPEVMNFGLPIARICGSWALDFLGINTVSNLICQFIKGEAYGQEICSSYSGFKTGYKRLENNGQFVASAFVSQAFNDFGFEKTKSAYVQSPKDWDEDRTYPVVIFLHGAMGNWQLYQGWLLGMDDYVVLSPGTRGLDGVWNKQDINSILTNQLAFLEKLGYKIDRKRVHLVGLSNGAFYGSSIALANYSKQFKSITFDVGGNKSGVHHKHEMHIYGRADAACPSNIKNNTEIKATDRYIYFPCCGHFANAFHPDEVREWLVSRWKEME